MYSKKNNFTSRSACQRRRRRRMGQAAMTVIGRRAIWSKYNAVRFGDLHNAWMADLKSCVILEKSRIPLSELVSEASKVKIWIWGRRWMILEMRMSFGWLAKFFMWQSSDLALARSPHGLNSTFLHKHLRDGGRSKCWPSFWWLVTCSSVLT